MVKEKGRVFPQMKWAKIRRLPIPDVSADRQQPVVKLVDRILREKRRNPTADTTDLEGKIDHLVYELYCLTPDEIEMVEAGT